MRLSDLTQFEQLEAERFDLRNDPEHRGPIFEPAGEHGFAARQLRLHRGEGGQCGSSESDPCIRIVYKPGGVAT